MPTIPDSVTQAQFETHILPYLSQAKRGPVCRVPLVDVFNLILYRLANGVKWASLPVERLAGQLSWQAVYYHFMKWSRDGSLTRVWEHSLTAIQAELDTTCLNLDGTHTPAKKGGESVAYQRRKRAKTTNILVMTDAKGHILATSPLMAGHHHDAFPLTTHVSAMLRSLKRTALPIQHAYLNADSAFDTKALRRLCFNRQLIPNIALNTRHRKRRHRGRPRLFNPAVYRHRFAIERTFAWLDSFRALLVRLDRSDTAFLAAFHLACMLINFRTLFAP